MKSYRKRENLKTLIKKKKVKKVSKLAKKKLDHNSKYWKNRADKAFGEYIHKRDEGCLVCGTIYAKLDAHHLISRGNLPTRHNPMNGVKLCVKHHKFDKECSPHMGPLGFSEFLRQNYPEKYDWVIQNKWKYSKYNFKENYENLQRLLEEL